MNKRDRMVLFSRLAKLYSELEKITSHKKIVEKLADFFNELKPEDAGIAAYLALGTIGPKYSETELGLAEKFSLRSIANAYGSEQEKVKRIYDQEGDLGDTAARLSKKKKSRLRIQELYDRLKDIRDASGRGSQEQKISYLSELLEKASSEEARYIMRIALARLRLGFGEKFLIEALARACTDSDKNANKIEEKYNVAPDIGAIAESLSKHGMKGIRRFSIKLGRPVQSMLAKRVDSVKELNKKFPGEMVAEEKYDGERAQIHYDQGKITIFSRRLEDITRQFPDIAEAVKKAAPKNSRLVLDGEIAAFENNSYGSFQKLMQRRRKYDVEEYTKKVPAVVFLFDMLYLNGRSLMKKPYPERRKLLEKNIKPVKRARLAKRVVSSDFSRIQEFFKKCIGQGLEGIVVKSTDKKSIYQAGKRGWLWVKWKKEYAEGMRETFDLVVIGSFYGKGSRKGRFGALLCAALNNDKNMYESFTKVGSGYTDQEFEKLGKKLKKLKATKKPANVSVDQEMEPDIYYEPELVIEVLGANITQSPKHVAGRESSGKGYALRFPRYVHLRPDKSAEQATTVKEIREMAEK